MNAMIFAAGLGTRLRPYTDDKPKAMVEVAGLPMIAHQLVRLRDAGFRHVVINVHHYAEQIIDYVTANHFGLKVSFSDERGLLLDTGGGIRKAISLFETESPILIHNVDIFSNANLATLYANHQKSKNDASLLVSQRSTSRYLIFDNKDHLVGWKNMKNNEVRTACDEIRPTLKHLNTDNEHYHLRAFSGIHIISPTLFPLLKKQDEIFSITNFYWQNSLLHHIRCVEAPEGFRWVDAGKPEALPIAAEIASSCNI